MQIYERIHRKFYRMKIRLLTLKDKINKARLPTLTPTLVRLKGSHNNNNSEFTITLVLHLPRFFSSSWACQSNCIQFRQLFWIQCNSCSSHWLSFLLTKTRGNKSCRCCCCWSLTHRKVACGLLQSQRPSHGKQLTPTFQTFKAHNLLSHPTAV